MVRIRKVNRIVMNTWRAAWLLTSELLKNNLFVLLIREDFIYYLPTFGGLIHEEGWGGPANPGKIVLESTNRGVCGLIHQK